MRDPRAHVGTFGDMNSHALTCGALAVAAAAAIVAVASPERADARLSIVYDDEAAASRIFTGPGALTPERGGLRQDPGRGGVFRDNDSQWRLNKLDGKVLATMSAQQMADTLRAAIDTPSNGAVPSGYVGVDEVGNHFRDPKVKVRYKYVTVRGKRIRVAAHNDVKITKHGYKVSKRQMTPPVPPESHPGMRLTRAMQILEQIPSPWGGSYASRVHFYLAPSFVTSITEGRGPHFTQGRAGSVPKRPGWRGVIGGVARAGHVWIEMYNGDMSPASAKTWREAPRRIPAYLARNTSGTPAEAHFLMTAAKRKPAGAAKLCAKLDPMVCQWALAGSTRAGRAVLANGPGAYSVGAQAGTWLTQYNVRFAD